MARKVQVVVDDAALRMMAALQEKLEMNRWGHLSSVRSAC